MADHKLKAESGSYEVRGSPVAFTHSWEYVKRKPLLLILLIVLTFGGPFLGLVLAGVPGVIVALVLAIICWVLGPLAVERVVERRTRDF